MIEKAQLLAADVLVLDLEDSVPLAEKETARKVISNSLEGLGLKGQKVYIRINALATGLAQEDLEAVVEKRLDGISLPKVGSAEEIKKVEKMIQALEGEREIERGHIRLIPWVETARGLVRTFEICSASPRVIGVAFGADDFTADMGIPRSQEGTELFYPRTVIAIAARAAEVMALDTPYVDFRDEKGLIQDAKLARQLGFQGKFLIHPDQIEPVNQVFRPSPEEVAHARRVVEAFEAAEARGAAATSLDGKMIDTPVAQRARKLLSLAEAIDQKEAASRG